MFVVGEDVIQYTRRRFLAGGKNHMRQLIVLLISVWTHLHVDETIDDVEWDDVILQSVDVLGASDLHRTIVDAVLVVLDLPARMYGAVDAMICILSKDRDDRTVLCSD